jgi:predicted Zn finger-like uncharacterized protein
MSEIGTSSPSHVATALLDGDSDGQRPATCPLCHTAHPSMTEDALASGVDYRCARCGQLWNAPRLATVTAYAAWVAEHDKPSGPGRV